MRHHQVSRSQPMALSSAQIRATVPTPLRGTGISKVIMSVSTIPTRRAPTRLNTAPIHRATRGVRALKRTGSATALDASWKPLITVNASVSRMPAKASTSVMTGQYSATRIRPTSEETWPRAWAASKSCWAVSMRRIAWAAL